MPPLIASLKDPHLERVRALTTRAGRRNSGYCLLEGAALIEQALTAGARLEFALRVTGEQAPIAETLAEHGVPLHEVKEALLRQVFRTRRPVGWVGVARWDTAVPAEFGPVAVVLDGIVDPGNLGTIARTAVGLGVPDVVCTDTETDLTSRKVLDASRAAVLRARIHQYSAGADAIRALHDHGFRVVATGSTGDALDTARVGSTPTALVVGNETHGVSDEVLHAVDAVVGIPMHGRVESLNVGVATGIALYELTRGR